MQIKLKSCCNILLHSREFSGGREIVTQRYRNYTTTMKVSLLASLTLVAATGVVASNTAANDSRCSGDTSAGPGQCSRSEARSARHKRQSGALELPNSAQLSFQTRLSVPQLPYGLYIVWIRVSFFIRFMFTESLM